MSIIRRRHPRLPRAEPRAETAIGLAMIAVAIMLSLVTTVVVARFGRLVLDGEWSLPAPATCVVLLVGFVLFSLARRRA